MLFHCRTQYSALFSTSLSIHINVASIWKIRYFHRRNFWEFRAPILKLEHSHRFDLLKVISVHFSQSSSPGYFAYIPPVLNKFTATRWCRSAKPERSIRFALLARRRSDWSVVIFVCIVLSDCHTLRPFIVLRWMPGTRRFWYAVQSVLSYVGSGSVIWNCSTLFSAQRSIHHDNNGMSADWIAWAASPQHIRKMFCITKQVCVEPRTSAFDATLSAVLAPAADRPTDRAAAIQLHVAAAFGVSNQLFGSVVYQTINPWAKFSRYRDNRQTDKRHWKQ